MRTFADLDAELVRCRACPRLVAWREGVAGTKAAFAGERYWARPVPGFGAEDAALAVVGLAPSAHGANRTGRMFTGDPSGDFLFRVLYEVGLASQPVSAAIGDGLTLRGTRLVSPVRCAPPENRPTPLSRTPAGTGWPTNWTCCGRPCARSSYSARSAGRHSCQCFRPRAGRCRNRARPSRTGPGCNSVTWRCSAVTTCHHAMSRPGV